MVRYGVANRCGSELVPLLLLFVVLLTMRDCCPYALFNQTVNCVICVLFSFVDGFC
jgi:hypothetical protein